MQIDNYEQAIALTNKLETSLPITARARKPFLKTLKQRGENASPEREFVIDYVSYSGDMGGIMCALKTEPDNPDNKERYVISITHLKIDHNHPLASEVQAYQHQRTRKLALQNQSGFAAQLLAKELSGERKRTRVSGSNQLLKLNFMGAGIFSFLRSSK